MIDIQNNSDKDQGGASMVRIKLTKRGQALVAKRKSKGGVTVVQKDVFKVYTIKKTGEKVLVNESKLFPNKSEYTKPKA